MAGAKTTRKMPPIEQLRGRTLGRILIKMGVIGREQAHECLKVQAQRQGKVKIGQILLELGLVDEEQLRMALAAQRGMEYVSIDNIDIPSDVIKRVPAQMAKTYHIVPLEYSEQDNELTVVLDSPENFRASDDLSTLMGFKVKAKMTDVDSPCPITWVILPLKASWACREWNSKPDCSTAASRFHLNPARER